MRRAKLFPKSKPANANTKTELIEPALRTVIVEPHIVHLVDLPAGTHMVYFVTEDNPLSVFYDPSSESFGAAWGPDESTGQYLDLGFRSDDVLDIAAA